jgi:quercetin dioxygenase-like cupin family protein
MALPHAASGDLINLRPLGDKLEGAPSTALLKTEHVELMRLVLSAGKSFPEHWVEGEITVQCLEGRIEFEARQDGHQIRHVMGPGELVYLAGGVPHALRALEDASVLVTILLHGPDNRGGPV